MSDSVPDDPFQVFASVIRQDDALAQEILARMSDDDVEYLAELARDIAYFADYDLLRRGRTWVSPVRPPGRASIPSAEIVIEP